MTQKKLKKKAFMIPMIQVELEAPNLNQLNKNTHKQQVLDEQNMGI